MQNPFTSQSKFLVSNNDLDHPALHALDNTEAVLEIKMPFSV
jgi:hypothetical protein